MGIESRAMRGEGASGLDGRAPAERYARIFRERWQALQGDLTNQEVALRLSRLLGKQIDPSRVSDWRNGKHIPSAAVFLAMVEASDRSVDEVLFNGRLSATRSELADELRRLARRVERSGRAQS
jgi:hypothetical protein